MKKSILTLIFAAVCFTSISFGQQDSTWKKWNWLIGDWAGEGSGVPGQGGGWFSLQPDLDGKILLRKNHSEYPATKDKPKIVHDDLMIVYFDYTGQPDKAIYFDNEGYTINYTITYAEKSIIFTSDKVQSSPLFRLTYVFLDKETIGIKFEMSRDGIKFTTYTEGRCIRKK
ncbi:MAG: hypothetical protein PHP42_10665 [Bacteroidota bacterium]|nr:hypothetical protein [Bacteroidota bacterium]